MKLRVTTKARQAEILKVLKRDGRAIVDDLAELL